jgi:hypothetical protein
MRSGLSGEHEPAIVRDRGQRSSPMSSGNGVVCPVCRGEEFRPVWRNLPELRFGILGRFSVRRCVVCDTHMTCPLPTQTHLNDMYERH